MLTVLVGENKAPSFLRDVSNVVRFQFTKVHKHVFSHFVEKKNTLGIHLFQKLPLETSEGVAGGSSHQRGRFQSEKGWLEELPVGGGGSLMRGWIARGCCQQCGQAEVVVGREKRMKNCFENN